ncbi:MAG: hypothetical protein ACJ74Q_06250 [Pyrinomonadaceae bacterium]
MGYKDQTYPVYNPTKAALVEAILARGRRADGLPRYNPDRGAELPVYRNTPEPQRLPTYNPESTPQGDERLTGEGGAELAARQTYPKYDPAAAQAGGQQVYPTFNAQAASGGYTKGPAAQHLDDLVNSTATDRNGRLRSGAKTALLAPTQPTDSLGNAIGQRIGNFITGALFKNSDEEIERRHDIARARPAAEREAAEEKRALDTENTRSEINLRDSTADFNRTTRAEEVRARAQDRNKRRLFDMLRSMPTVDPSKHAAFLGTWQRTFGEPFDVDVWNAKKGNFVVRDLFTDPLNPQQKHSVAINFADGSTRDLGVSGYAATRDADGRTTADVKTDEDRDAGRVETTRHNRVTEAQGGERIGIARGHLTLAQAAQDKSFSDTDRKAYGEAAKLLAEAEQASNEADAYVANATYKDKDTGQMVRSRKYDVKAAELQAKAEALRERLYSVYGDLWRKEDGQLHMTSAEWRQNHPNVPVSIASRYKIIIDDDPSMNPSTPQGRNMPPLPSRSTVPARPRPSAAPHSQPRAGEDANVRAYADEYFGGDYTKAQAAVEEQRARKARP